MIGSPTSPSSRDDPAGLLSASASLWPPPWLNLLLAAIIIGWYCKKHILFMWVYVLIMWHVIMIKGYNHTAIHIAGILIYYEYLLSHLHSQQSRMPIRYYVGSILTKTTLQKKKNHGNTKYTSSLMRYRILLNVMILLAYLGCTASVVLDGDSGMQVCNLCHLIRICMSTNHYRPTISIPFIWSVSFHRMKTQTSRRLTIHPTTWKILHRPVFYVAPPLNHPCPLMTESIPWLLWRMWQLLI